MKAKKNRNKWEIGIQRKENKQKKKEKKRRNGKEARKERNEILFSSSSSPPLLSFLLLSTRLPLLPPSLLAFDRPQVAFRRFFGLEKLECADRSDAKKRPLLAKKQNQDPVILWIRTHSSSNKYGHFFSERKTLRLPLLRVPLSRFFVFFPSFSSRSLFS